MNAWAFIENIITLLLACGLATGFLHPHRQPPFVLVAASSEQYELRETLMTRRQRLILRVAARRRAHKGYRDIEAKLIRATLAQLRREIRQGAKS